MDLQRGRKELIEKTEENIEKGRKSVIGRKKNEEGIYEGEIGPEGRRGWGDYHSRRPPSKDIPIFKTKRVSKSEVVKLTSHPNNKFLNLNSSFLH